MVEGFYLVVVAALHVRLPLAFLSIESSDLRRNRGGEGLVDIEWTSWGRADEGRLEACLRHKGMDKEKRETRVRCGLPCREFAGNVRIGLVA